MKKTWGKLFAWNLVLVALLLAGCGGSSSSSAAPGAANVNNANSSSGYNSTSNTSSSEAGNASNTSSSASSKSSAGQNQVTRRGLQKNAGGSSGPQYLIKTLAVTMAVKNTWQAADDLQTWLTTTDPHAISEGMNYQQVGDGSYTYNITMSYSVQADLYPQVQRHLRDFAPQQHGQLLGFQESVQDITNDYIDTQSRLKNLRGEQARLLDLLNHAQMLSDILTVQQSLTDVEGQIEQIEEHISDLSNQLHFYTVNITLQPTDIPVSQPTTPGWSVGQVFHDAFVASLAFAQGLLTLLIWLLAFSVYIVPVLALAWCVHRWRKHARILPPSIPKA